jgi:anti-anti-sigma factor
MAQPELQVLLMSEGDRLVVRLIGEAHFDFDAADRYVRQILTHKPQVVIIDASKLTFASSVGMNFLIHLHKALAAQGAALRLAALQPMVYKALKSARLLKMFDVYADVDAAKAAPKV